MRAGTSPSTRRTGCHSGRCASDWTSSIVSSRRSRVSGLPRPTLTAAHPEPATPDHHRRTVEPRTVAAAVRFADEYNAVSPSLEEARDRAAIVARAADEARRPPLVFSMTKACHRARWLPEELVAPAIRRATERRATDVRPERVLTAREYEVARLVAQGLSNKHIAHALAITEGTVKIHLHKMYESSGANAPESLAVLMRTAQGPRPTLAGRAAPPHGRPPAHTSDHARTSFRQYSPDPLRPARGGFFCAWCCCLIESKSQTAEATQPTRASKVDPIPRDHPSGSEPSCSPGVHTLRERRS